MKSGPSVEAAHPLKGPRAFPQASFDLLWMNPDIPRLKMRSAFPSFARIRKDRPDQLGFVHQWSLASTVFEQQNTGLVQTEKVDLRRNPFFHESRCNQCPPSGGIFWRS